MAGEEAHDTGHEGLQRAKQWLDLTTRVRASWTYQERQFRSLVHFRWPHDNTEFSFDIGGRFQSGKLHDQSFLSEIKKYRYESDLPEHFRNFLAKCYVAFGSDRPELCDHFLWISWSPFQARAWHLHASTDNVKKSVMHEANRGRVLGVNSEADALNKFNSELAAKVAERLWLVTLCDKQEDLTLTAEHYYEFVSIIARERGVGS